MGYVSNGCGGEIQPRTQRALIFSSLVGISVFDNMDKLFSKASVSFFIIARLFPLCGFFFSEKKLQNLIGLGPPATITIDIADKDQRKKQNVMREGALESHYVFSGQWLGWCASCNTFLQVLTV